jgi:SAM-dependent methyltransferase
VRGRLPGISVERARLTKSFIFDQALQAELREAKAAHLRRVFHAWQPQLGLKTAMDTGCGIGFFSGVLHDLGMRVTASDGRQENVVEARTRYPSVEFHVADVEDPLPNPETFDLVLCFGLLYHLENPLRAMRQLRSLTGKLLLLESLCIPDEQPFMFLLDEPTGEDQSLRAVSCYPSEGAMIKMAYRAGFPRVYRFRELPDHDHFRAGVGRVRMRTTIAASLMPIESPLIVPAPEPMPSGDLWTTDRTGATKIARKVRRFFKRSSRKPS